MFIQVEIFGLKADIIYSKINHTIQTNEKTLDFLNSRVHKLSGSIKERCQLSISSIEADQDHAKRELVYIIEARQIAWN